MGGSERLKGGSTMCAAQTNPELSEKQRDIINHRLEVADAIVEVMSEGDEGYHPNDVKAVVDLLYNGDWAEAQKASGLMVADILRDCVEGSTLPALYADACENGEILNSQYQRLIREGDELAEKIREVDPCDREPVKFPRC